MKRWPSLVAAGLLLVAIAVDSFDWWTAHDLETLAVAGRLPMVGGTAEATLAARIARPELAFGIDASYPPFASVSEEGEMEGFEVDLALELGRRIAGRTTLVNMDAGDAAFDALVARRVDAVIAGLTRYPDLPRTVALSVPYFEAGPVTLAPDRRPDLREVRDLAGQRIAVETGSLGEEEAQKLQQRLPGVKLARLDDGARALASVAEGAADAAVLDRQSLPGGALPLEGYHTLGPLLRSVPYLVAVRKKDQTLLRALNVRLGAMREEGLLLQLEKRWFR